VHCFQAALVAAAVLGPPSRGFCFDPLSTGNSYDYVVITTPPLASEAARLATHRASTGLRTGVITTTELASAFGGLDTMRVRDCVLYGISNWRIAPTYFVLLGDSRASWQTTCSDELPTRFDSLPDYPGYGTLYAWDAWYTLPDAPEKKKPLARIGRIPAASITEAAKYVDKVISYDSPATQGAWLSDCLFLVGDRYSQNAGIGVLAEEIWDVDLADWITKSELRSSNFSEATVVEAATAATQSDWNTGNGVVLAFGQTTGPSTLVYMAWLRTTMNDQTRFTTDLIGNGRLPFLFGASCEVNQYQPCQTTEVFGTDLILSESDRGAIATLAPSSTNPLTEGFYSLRAFLNVLLQRQIRETGRLAVATYLVTDEIYDSYDFARNQCVLLGDPALQLKVPTSLSAEWRGGAEIEDVTLSQDVVNTASAGIASPWTRLVDANASLIAGEGERFLRAKAVDVGVSTRDWIEWKLSTLDVPISENLILSWKMNVVDSPFQKDRICLDALTSGGSLGSNPFIFDQNGERLDAKNRQAAASGWQTFYCDLTPLSGSTLESITLRYEAQLAAESAGALDAWIDDIRVFPANAIDEYDDILNGSFETDEDDDAVPDFWSSIPTLSGSALLVQVGNVATDSTHSLRIIDTDCLGQGASQTLHVPPYVGELAYAFSVRSPTNCPLLVRAVDAATASVLAQQIITTGSVWSYASIYFLNPYYFADYGRVRLDFIPQVCDEPVEIDGLRRDQPTQVPESSRRDDLGVSPRGAILLLPNPTHALSQIRLRVDGFTDGALSSVLFDPSGRRVCSASYGPIAPGPHEFALVQPAPNGNGLTVAPGRYVLQVLLNDEPVARSLVTLIR